MAFNPDEYLKKQGGSKGGFDPDAYLAKGSNGMKVLDVAGPAQAALENYGNVATAGYLPQLQAGMEKLRSAIDTGAAKLGVGPETPEMVDEKLREQGFKIVQAEPGYLEMRDENSKRMAQQEKDFPKASMAGKALGMVGSGLLGSRVLGATKGATVGDRMWDAAKTGGIMGAAANPGDTEGEIDPLQLEARLKNAVLGGVIGGGVQGVAEAAGPLLTAAKDWMRNKAALKATRALGRPTPTQAAQMAETGQDVAIGRELLDEGAVPVLGTPKRIQGRVDALREKAGQDVGKIIDSAGDAKVIDAERLGLEILDSPQLAQMRKTPGMESAVAAIEKQVETLAKNGQLNLKEAQALRQGIDKSINFNKAAPEMRGAQEGLYQQRTAIRDAMNEAVNEMSPGATKDALKTANRRYGNFSEASDILEREVGRDQANRSIGLTDTIAAAAGLANGSPGVGLALGALNKAGRTFGNSMQARGYDVAAGLAGAGAGLAKTAAESSPAIQAMVNRLLTPGEFKESEFRDILNNQQIMQQFQKDPRLLDAIRDDKLKAAISRKIIREPAGSAMQRRLGR